MLAGFRLRLIFNNELWSYRQMADGNAPLAHQVQASKASKVVAEPTSSGSFDSVTHDQTVLHSAQDDTFVSIKGVIDNLYVDTA